MDDIRVVIALAGFGVVLIGHLIGFIWWAATLTNRVSHIEDWIKSNEALHAQVITMTAKIEILLRSNDAIKANISRLYDKIDQKVDK